MYHKAIVLVHTMFHQVLFVAQKTDDRACIVLNVRGKCQVIHPRQKVGSLSRGLPFVGCHLQRKKPASVCEDVQRKEEWMWGIFHNTQKVAKAKSYQHNVVRSQECPPDLHLSWSK